MATEEFTGEEWRPIKGFPYEVSDFGRVRRRERAVSRRAGTYLKGFPSRGYLDVVLCRDGECSRRRIHHIVAEAFVGPRPLGYQTNHKDGDKLNNRADNLEWVSAAENIAHSYRTGLAHGRKGSRHHGAVLTEAIVAKMREEFYAGAKAKEIAAWCGCSVKNVRHVINGDTWGHV